MPKLIKVRIEADHDTESPCNSDCQWMLYSFNRHDRSFRSPDVIQRQYGIGLQSKLRAGTAFLLGYYEHGLCQWALSGEQQACRWDSVNAAGILIWEHPLSELGARTREDRAKDARAFLEEYTAWCNGECYGYSIETCDVPEDWEGDAEDDIANSQWEEYESCWGFIGRDYLVESVRYAMSDLLQSGARIEIVTGDSGDMVSIEELSKPDSANVP